MLRHFFELQNRRCESFRVISPLMISVEDDLPGLSNWTGLFFTALYFYKLVAIF